MQILARPRKYILILFDEVQKFMVEGLLKGLYNLNKMKVILHAHVYLLEIYFLYCTHVFRHQMHWSAF